MTPTEAAELQELGLTPDQLKAKQQALASVTAPQTANNAVRLTNLGKCPECGAAAVFHDRNRLANCGHVRRSHGKLVRVGEKPKQPEAISTGVLTTEQADDLRALVGEVQQRERDKREADAALRDAVARFNRMLEELQGKR